MEEVGHSKSGRLAVFRRLVCSAETLRVGEDVADLVLLFALREGPRLAGSLTAALERILAEHLLRIICLCEHSFCRHLYMAFPLLFVRL